MKEINSQSDSSSLPSNPFLPLDSPQSEGITVGNDISAKLLSIFPHEILAKIFIDSKSTHNGVNRQFQLASKIAMNHFWIENFSKNLAFDKIINILRSERIKDEKIEWDLLPNNQKLKNLYLAMVKKIQDADPRALENLNVSVRNLDFSLYQELAHLTDLIAIQQRITWVLWPELCLQEIPVSEFQEILNDPEHQSTFQELKHLDLSDLQLTHLPREIDLFTNLESISLDNNYLTSIPQLSQFTKMSELSLRNNKIRILQEASLPPSLIVLDLRLNQIATLEKTAWPTELALLRLSSNEIHSLKGAELPHRLTWLYLDHNPIAGLEDITLSEGLQVLHLGDHMIDSLANIKKWPPSLREVVLIDNQCYLSTSSISENDPKLKLLSSSQLPPGLYPDHLKIYRYQ